MATVGGNFPDVDRPSELLAEEMLMIRGSEDVSRSSGRKIDMDRATEVTLVSYTEL